ncbi:NAD(P)/FAD-dependent oxidoreductase [Streptomyces sp. FXJ1.4098]|uniref:NAD(P)/FAD-dependent oxidoreductase n=1 Tax=Streptomyces sp. NPDC020845 TaxID=3365096 RepID=UPI0029928EBA|nr:NAD(P)/FAD-dependent oxidoreductase [Streptomyces sp. FXJ1.4098]
MLTSAHRTDVVIVGAGLAGLAAAHQLTSAGVTVSVLEAAPQVGGRMATDLTDGFRLDRSGQLVNTSFPELQRTPGLGGLVLRPFSPGVLVRADGRTHRVGATGTGGWATGSWGTGGRGTNGRGTNGRGASGRGTNGRGTSGRGTRGALTTARALANAARAPLGGALDQARLGAALGRLAALPADRLLTRPDRPVAETLAGRGLPARTVEGFLRPLLVSLLSDPELTTSSRCADLVLRGYARGRLCLPAGGASAVPELLAAALPPGTVRTGIRAVTASTTAVATAEHGEIACRSILVATGARAAADLLPGLRLPSFHPVTVLHHTADSSPLREPALVLTAGDHGPVAHTAVASEVDPSRTPPGRVLITSTVLGAAAALPTAELDRAARAQLAAVYGTSTAHWELLAAHHDPYAVPAMPAPHDLRRPVRLLSGLYVCGDHRDSSTVQGALVSGRRAARAILHDLGALPGAEPTAPDAAAA